MKRSILGSIVIGLMTYALVDAASAAAPELRTPAPVIYLADNLDEKDKLGWCIDTLGRGFSERIQAHSCKPQGGDVQFIFKEDTGQIASVEFAGKCMTLNDPQNEKVPFGLLDCTSNASQEFTYDAAAMQIRFAGDETLCVAVSPTSRRAGPFMSRDLILSPCSGTDNALLQWMMKL